MSNDSVVSYENPSQWIVKDELTLFLKSSAQTMLQAAIEAEVNEFVSQHKEQQLANGQQRVVRNGYLPERSIQTGIGPMSVKQARVRDKGGSGGSAITFNASLVPKYMRRTVTLDVFLPLLYLKGVSTGDFQSALTPLLGAQAKSISPGVISQLKRGWLAEYQAWSSSDLPEKEYVYWWADGVYLTARMETEKTCLLVIIGADKQGKKEVVALVDGFRESKENWRALLSDLHRRGLKKGARLAIGDGALGLWGALNELYPETKHQRCWVHKTANVLAKLPKSEQARAKSRLQDIYLAATREHAYQAYDAFIEDYQLKYTKAVACLEHTKKELLTFYDFPAEHWGHIRTTNPIESTFATVKHRTKKSKNCFSRDTIIASTFKLLQEAQKRWKKLYGYQRLAEVIQMKTFVDGLPVDNKNRKEILTKIDAA